MSTSNITKLRANVYVPNGHPKEKPTIKLGEIIGVNPNSYKTIKEVLFNILQQVKSDERTSVKIGFDGVPYRIAKELIDTVHFCNGCEEISDLKEDSLETHLLHFHDGDSNVSVKPYFGDILLVPVPGHMERIFLLTIFKFTKDIFMFKLPGKLTSLQMLRILSLIVGITIYPGRLQILYLIHSRKN